ncbi:MAG: cytochrome [Acidimicrobiales bacterium]|nr:cytochrome [Acidimicrobiales bacterium]
MEEGRAHPIEDDPLGHERLFAVDQETLKCPYQVYGALRERPALPYSAQIEAFIVSRYDDVMEVLRQPALFSSAQVHGPRNMRETRASVERLAQRSEAFRDLAREVDKGHTAVMIYADPPVHTRQRALVSRAFTPRQVRQVEPLVRRTCNDLIDSFIDDGAVEIVSAYTAPLPIFVIADWLGIPPEDKAFFLRWSDARTANVGNHGLSDEFLQQRMEEELEFFAYFERRVARARSVPADDLVSAIVGAQLPNGDSLSTVEIVGIISQLLVAGNETLRNNIASAVLEIARTPGLGDLLRADEHRIDEFVEEILRTESPVQGLYRTATADTVLAGTDIPAGAAVWLAYGSANRDPAVFEAPDGFDLGRGNLRQHLAFGFGEHVCVGAPLARLEARIAVELLLERLTSIEAPPASELRYVSSYVVHGPVALPITFQRR